MSGIIRLPARPKPKDEPFVLTKKNKRLQIYRGDCLTVMRNLIKEGVQVDSIVTDPPYHLQSIVKRFGKVKASDDTQTSDRLNKRSDQYARQAAGFGGMVWDGGDIAFDAYTWQLAFKVIKPGGWLLAFSGTRTYHKMAIAIEEAGFEIRDSISWLYSTGFPKSHDAVKAIDQHFGKKPKIVGKENFEGEDVQIAYKAVTKEAAEWQGWGTALKPACEPICMARKPLSEKTNAANILKHRTAMLNIDGSRIAGIDPANAKRLQKSYGETSSVTFKGIRAVVGGSIKGRWPANLIHDGSDEVIEEFAKYDKVAKHNSESLTRFFYSAKASRADKFGSKHPTVKPTSLMKYLIRMVTPPGGTTLDMFAGSGSSVSASLEIPDNKIIAIELSKEYMQDILRRVEFFYEKPTSKMTALF